MHGCGAMWGCVCEAHLLKGAGGVHGFAMGVNGAGHTGSDIEESTEVLHFELKSTLQGGVQSSHGFNLAKNHKNSPWTQQNQLEKCVPPMVDLKKPMRLSGSLTQMTKLPFVSPRV
jgi:hypothetical protein